MQSLRKGADDLTPCETGPGRIQSQRQEMFRSAQTRSRHRNQGPQVGGVGEIITSSRKDRQRIAKILLSLVQPFRINSPELSILLTRDSGLHINKLLPGYHQPTPAPPCVSDLYRPRPCRNAMMDMKKIIGSIP